MEEEQLLREIAFLSKLINNHKQNNVQPTQPICLKSQLSEKQSNIHLPQTNYVKKTETTSKPTSSEKNSRFVTISSLQKHTSNVKALQRIVMTPAKEKRRLVVVNSSTPKNNLIKINSPALSPILIANKKNEHTGNRVVLKSSRYKWASKVTKNDSNTTQKSNVIAQQKIVNKISLKNGLIESKTPNKISTKYKLVRQSSSPRSKVRSIYKLVNSSPNISNYMFVRKVGKYSIKYVDKKLQRRQMENNFYNSSFRKYSVAKRKRKLSSMSWTKHTDKNGSDKFVVIGGRLYRSNRTKLAKTERKLMKSSSGYDKSNLSTKTINVRGVKYLLDPFGKTLKRLTPSPSISPTKPSYEPNFSRVDIGGETFVQTQPGILVLSQANKSRNLANRSKNRSINRLVAAKKKASQFCLFYNRFGKCSKKELGTCPYIHDPDKIAVCTRFLRGKCTVENCPFSHKICARKMPVCIFFLRGRCSADNCPYSHVNVNPKAEICKDFLKGFCSLEEKCKKQHVFSCLEFQRTGKCSNTKCPFKHVKKSVKRKAPDAGNVKKSSPPSSSAPLEMKSEKTNKLPSFIKLEDESQSTLNESTISTPLRIKPQFF